MSISIDIEKETYYGVSGTYRQQLIDAGEIALIALIALIDEMHSLYIEALSERPHPDNPYVTTWTSGGVAEE